MLPFLSRALDSAGTPITRQYTPTSPPDEEGSFDVLIKVRMCIPLSPSYNPCTHTPHTRDTPLYACTYTTLHNQVTCMHNVGVVFLLGHSPCEDKLHT